MKIQHKQKGIILSILCVILVVALCFFALNNSFEQKGYSNNVETNLGALVGRGTEEDPLLITSDADMVELQNTFMANRDKYISLTNDVTINLSRINGFLGGSTSQKFTGTFDGNEHTINITYSAGSSASASNIGLFLSSNGATIKNVNVVYQNVSIQNVGTILFGGIVGSASNTTIENCSTGGDISINGANISNIGGLVGTGSNVVINNSTSKLNIDFATRTTSGQSNVGGLVGKVSGSSQSLMANTINKSNYSATTGIQVSSVASSNAIVIVGGIVGTIDSDRVSINQCYNTATFASNVTRDFKLRYGGLVGSGVGVTSSNAINIENCFNSGNIDITTTSTTIEHIGGLVGYGKYVNITTSHSYISVYNKTSSKNSDIKYGLIIGCSSGNENTGTNTLSDCFGYSVNGTINLSGSENIAGASKLSVEEFANKESFTNWNFFAVWVITTEDTIISNGSFPILRGVGDISFEQEYKLRYHIDGVDSVAYVEETYMYGQDITIKSVVESFEIVGKHIVGWAKDYNSTSFDFAVGTNITCSELYFTDEGLLDLYAKFETDKFIISVVFNKEEISNSYNFTFDSNLMVDGGVYYGYYGTTYTVTKPNDIFGYTFDHWEYSTEQIENVQENGNDITFTIKDKDVVITAIYYETYTVTIKSQNNLIGLVSFDGVTYKSEDSFTALENTTFSLFTKVNAEGYEFKKWIYTIDQTEYFGATTNLKLTEDLELTAVFDIIEYKVEVVFSSNTQDAGTGKVVLQTTTPSGISKDNITSNKENLYVYGKAIDISFEVDAGCKFVSVKLIRYVEKTDNVAEEIVFGLNSGELNFVGNGYRIDSIESNFKIELVIDSEYYTINLAVNTVKGDTSTAKFEDLTTQKRVSFRDIDDSMLKIIATVGEMVEFDGWSVAVDTGTKPVSEAITITSLTSLESYITMIGADVTITANFRIKTFSIVLNIDSLYGDVFDNLREDRVAYRNGDIIQKNYGENLTLYFVPIEYYQIDKIILTNSSSIDVDITLDNQNNVRTFYTFEDIKDNYTLNITFEVERFKISVSDVSEISIDCVSIYNTDTEIPYTLISNEIELSYGTRITIRILNSQYVSGYKFGKFIITQNGQEPEENENDRYSFTLTNNIAFELITLINVRNSGSSNGGIQFTYKGTQSENIWCEYGATITVTATPDIGYKFVQFNETGLENSPQSFELQVIKTTSFSATFESKEITIRIIKAGTGKVTQESSTIKTKYIIGDYVEFSVEEVDGVEFLKFTVIRGSNETQLIGGRVFSYNFTAEDAENGQVNFKAYFDTVFVNIDITLEFVDGGDADACNAKLFVYNSVTKAVTQNVDIKKTVTKQNNKYKYSMRFPFAENVLITATDPNRIDFSSANDDWQVIYFYPEDNRYYLEDCLWIDVNDGQEKSIISNVGQNGSGSFLDQLTYNSEIVAKFKAIYWADVFNRADYQKNYVDGKYFKYNRWSGSGSQEDPFLIQTEEQLSAIFYAIDNKMITTRGELYRNLHYKLDRDLNLTSKFWNPIGREDDDYKMFLGSFNFNYHDIRGIENLNYDAKTYYNGLFGCKTGTIIKPFVVNWVAVSIIFILILLIVAFIIYKYIKKKIKNKKHVVIPSYPQYPNRR